MISSRLSLPTVLFLLHPFLALSQVTNPFIHSDPFEVRTPSTWQQPDPVAQSIMRKGAYWTDFAEDHPHWQVQFHPATGTVHRAYGPAIPVEDAAQWLQTELEQSVGEWLEWAEWSPAIMGRHALLRSVQMVDGRPVLGTEIVVKAAEEGVVMWGAICFSDAQWPDQFVGLNGDAVLASAKAGLELEGMEAELGEEALLPMRLGPIVNRTFEFRPVRNVTVSGSRVDGTPVMYATLVDLENGEILERLNRIQHTGQQDIPEKSAVKAMGPASLAQALTCQVTGTVHLTQPFDPPVEVALDHLSVQTQQGPMVTSSGGMLNLDGDAPQDIGLQLQGLWSQVSTNGVTPQVTVTLEEDGTVNLDGMANIRELSAYHSVNRIHDHMAEWLPGFEGLDFALPTLVDVSGTCNAFYTPGSPSINFYSEGDGCNAFSTVADVVFHEYGHGINDLYYESLGSNFINGAMGEGYADLWAISLTDNPILGGGCYSENPDFFIRRYDENPKVYPQDLVGQVHADGEIICGAWYDTHLLMGGDWANTRNLFVEAYAGQQATTPNGNEGQAFVEVLLDVLQADDDNADLSDGTPNGAAILQGFGMHGITLFSNVDIAHQAMEYADAGVSIGIEANAAILFPFSQYFESFNLFYRTHPNDPWVELSMDQTADGAYAVEVPEQESGTVLEYHFGITDIYGATSAIEPYMSNVSSNPNLPFNTIIGLTPVLVDDQDDYSEFGFWQLGIPEDNATTGMWESAIPVGSYSDFGDPSSICAPSEDHTPGDGIYAFITGISPGEEASIGSNDVDNGSTTLQSEAIDISGLTSPVLSYWRWYVNAPASGANPGADWWQVQVSADAGANWVNVEETLTQDISWRRHAFAIADYVPITDAFSIKFTASDSLRPDQGLEFDGGSLIEAAVDDLVIHDVATMDVSEVPQDAGIVTWPVPFSGQLHSVGWAPLSEVVLLDAGGREVARTQSGPGGDAHFALGSEASGIYILSGSSNKGEHRRKEVIRTSLGLE